MQLKHRIEYAAFRAALAASNLVDVERAAKFGAMLGGLAYPLNIRRDIVLRNLRIAFPDKPDEWHARIARASFEHLGRETMVTMRLGSMSREDVVARTRMVNEEVLRTAFDRGRGVVVVAGHLGNWELGAATASVRDYPVDVIAKRARNPRFYQHVLDARERLGVHVIDFQRAPRQALASLRAGRIVAFAADQHAGRAGLWLPYFGRLASTYRGPAIMALRTDAPVILSCTLRQPDGTYENRFETIEYERSGDRDRDVVQLTQAWVRRLEAAVRVSPEQYMWQHRRWRAVPPDVAEAAPGEDRPSQGTMTSGTEPRSGHEV